MNGNPEDSLSAAGSSNAPPRSEPRALCEACRVVGSAEGSSGEIERLLELALTACGVERAFLIRGVCRPDGSLDPVVEACRVQRDDGRRALSRSVALGVLDREGTFASVDLLGDRRVHRGESVRALELRRVLAAPLPGAKRDRRFLYLDSRRPSAPIDVDGAIDLAEAFAALIAAIDGSSGAANVHSGDAPSGRTDFAGRSSTMLATLAWARRVARSHLPVLVRGETGSGKEGIARLIHENSTRTRGPFVAFNCTALTESLVEAELFGSTRGAYTGSTRDRRGLFRLAQGGTLLLDEVGDMPPATQAKLLRTLQENRVRPVGGEADLPIDVRIVAATHRDLERLVETGRFRRDLYYRLAVVQVDVPPLRDRLGDLPSLVGQLSTRLERETGFGPVEPSRRALTALQAHDWPGNVRELHAVLARAILRAGGPRIDDFHLGPLGSVGGPPAEGDAGLERRMIESALRTARGEIAAAAREIGWSRQKLYRSLRALGIRPSEA